MDSLNSILKDKNFDEPPEISGIKQFVQERFQVPVSVLIRGKDLVIVVDNAGLASALRLCLPDLKRRVGLTKPVILRISTDIRND